MSDSLWPQGLQHTRLPCPLLFPGVYPNSRPLSQWCHPTISSSVAPVSSYPQSFPASGSSFPMSWLFASGGQSIGASDPASVLPMNQHSLVTQSCPTLCDPRDWSMPGFPVHHRLPELAQTHVHHFGDAIQTSHSWIFRANFFWGWLVWWPCCPRDSSITIWKHELFSPQPSLWSNSHIHTWLLEKLYLWLYVSYMLKN